MTNSSQTIAFFSVDMVDSTKFKREHREIWPRYFRAFSQHFPSQISGFWRNTFENLDMDRYMEKASPEAGYLKDIVDWNAKVSDKDSKEYNSAAKGPSEWKSLGDEIIFAKFISHPGELFLSLLLFHRFMQMKSKYRPDSEHMPGVAYDKVPYVKVKGTVWLSTVYQFEGKHDGPANASARNISSVVRPGEGIISREFLGPDIDEGFRISGFSAAEFITLSVHAAVFLLAARSLFKSDLHFSLERGAALKGFSPNVEYPKIFLRISKTDNEILNGANIFEEIISRKHISPKDQIYEGIILFLDKNLEQLGSPRIALPDGGEYLLEKNEKGIWDFVERKPLEKVSRESND